jgi:hypothetical protein
MNGRYVSALSPAERLHLEYLEAHAACRRGAGGQIAPPVPDESREDELRRRWVACAEDDLRRERELLFEWAGHDRPSWVRPGRTAAVALAGLTGAVCWVVLRLFT